MQAITICGAGLSASGSGGVAGAQPPANFPQPSGLPAAPRTFADYWNLYVPQHLLPRLHAFELMMAPYAIAHMKIGLKLAETGYRFGTEERARIYLTNALEPWVKQLPLIGFDALAHEAAAVNEIKRHKRFTVVIGNPPYSGISSNMTDYAQRIVDAYKIRELLDGEGDHLEDPISQLSLGICELLESLDVQLWKSVKLSRN